MLLNHLAVPVPDIAAARGFFETHFGMRCFHAGADIAVLGDAGGFALALSLAEDAVLLPEGLHVGFMQKDETAVREAYARLMAAGVEPAHPLAWFAGALGFHCRAPGGLLVEVSWRPGVS